MGVQWGYEWNHVYTQTHDVYSSTFPYQVVNNVRSTVRPQNPESSRYITWTIGIDGGCPGARWLDDTPAGQAALQACVADIAASHKGLYWMIWNEPDLEGGGSDTFSPALGARYFRQISDTILSADPTAKLIVGNVSSEYRGSTSGCGTVVDPSGCGVNWLTQFISSYLTMTNGVDPRPAISGYGIHAYSDAAVAGLGLSPCLNILDSRANECLLSHFTATIKAGTDWVYTHDHGKEVWVTEVNWESGDQPGDTWLTQTVRMQQICAELAADLANKSIQRYSWFYGSYPYSIAAPGFITVSLYSADLSGSNVIYTGTLSPAGHTFIGCPR
jgi:hypothetical protein